MMCNNEKEFAGADTAKLFIKEEFSEANIDLIKNQPIN